MTRKADLEYFAEREAAEYLAAQAAETPAAKALHLQMAYHYAAIRSQMGEPDETLPVILKEFGMRGRS